MENQPTISVIIPTLNEELAAPKLVGYLLRHGGNTVKEILVVDAESTDRTQALCRAAGAEVLVLKKKSRAAQMNLGAQKAQGDILYFVHADTQPPVSFAGDILQASAQGKTIGCYRYQFNSPSWMLKINAATTRFNWSWTQGGDKTLYIPKSVFFDLGGYDEYYVIMEEYDFMKKLLKNHAFHVIQKNALVSARKYEGRSWLRVQIANLIAFNQFRFGVHPQKIKETYSRLLGKV